jgi:hypothetical protein
MKFPSRIKSIDAMNFYIYTRTPSSSGNLPSGLAGSKRSLSVDGAPKDFEKEGKQGK